MCLEHVPPLKLPAALDTCWMRGCCSTRPDMAAQPEAVVVVAPEPIAAADGTSVCACAGCNEIARPRSKYCSRRCSNRNARRRFKKRKKEERAAA